MDDGKTVTNWPENLKTHGDAQDLLARDGIDRLYAARKKEEEDFSTLKIKYLEEYVEKNKERLYTATRIKTNNTKLNRTNIMRKQ